MLLAADADLSGAAQRRRGDGLGGIAVDEGIVRHHDLARRAALLDGDIRLFRVNLDLAAQHRTARGVARGGDDREDRLMMEEHLILHQDRLIGARGRDVVLAGYIRRGHDGDDTGRSVHPAQIDAAQCAARHRRAADGDMQGADRLRNVVNIFGVALHMLGAAVVRQRLVDMAQRRLQDIIRRHRRTPGDRQCA